MTRITFLDFHSFEQLQASPEILDSLVHNYCRIFGEPDIWNENYEPVEMCMKIAHELEGCAAMRLAVLEHTGEVVGFCWAQLLDLDHIIQAMETVHYFQAQGDGNISDLLHERIHDEQLIFVQDLGVNREHRGTIPLENLICPVLDDVSSRSGTRKLFFWSVDATCIGWLARKIGIHPICSAGKMQFFYGEYPNAAQMMKLIAKQQVHRRVKKARAFLESLKIA